MKVSLRMRTADIAAFKQSLNMATQKIVTAADASLDAAASHACTLAQARTPQVTGALRASARLTPNNAGERLQRTISYGNSVTNPRTGRPTSKYAKRVHETFNPKRPNSYKWLEYAIRDYGKEQFMHDLAANLKSAL